jgi:hypothetical protein
MADQGDLEERLAHVAGRYGASCASEPFKQGAGRIVWLTASGQPNIGVIMVPAEDDVQIVCDDYTFEELAADTALGVIDGLLAGRASVRKNGKLLRSVVLSVPVGDVLVSASRSASGEFQDWEERLSGKPN